MLSQIYEILSDVYREFYGLCDWDTKAAENLQSLKISVDEISTTLAEVLMQYTAHIQETGVQKHSVEAIAVMKSAITRCEDLRRTMLGVCRNGRGFEMDGLLKVRDALTALCDTLHRLELAADDINEVSFYSRGVITRSAPRLPFGVRGKHEWL
ncbi:hypothetical protein EJ06DRAFT_256536 [Trichodelitschia bisporula]|uniref:Uncharacterized protein n=1 Tax=Trichodelitschia bisporula TaxID=703511 RepID=A0A6G1HIN3_9PEZI|nr:hypothetical protein EJ06DRAFT_256536 [Trichodelitschia bisporula]